MPISPKRYVAAVVAALVLPVAAVLALNWAVDPLLLFRLDRHEPQVFFADDAGYYSNAGIARQYEFDLALFGESTARDVVTSDLSAIFGMPAQKLAFTSGSYGLLTEVFEFVHAERGIRYAIFDVIPDYIDLRFTRYHPDWVQVSALYDSHRANDLGIYLSTDMAELSLRKLRAKRRRPDGLCPRSESFVYDLDQLNMHLRFNKCTDSLALKGGDLASHRRYWQSHWPPLERWDTEAHRETATRMLERAFAPDSGEPSKRLRRIRKNVARFRALVASHEDVSFTFYFPPRPAYRYTARMLANPQRFAWMLRGIREFVHGVAPLPNARVFGFGDRDFTRDWRNYLEGSHYRPEITHRILGEIAAGNGRLIPENVDAYLERFVAAVGETQLPAAIYQEAAGPP